MFTLAQSVTAATQQGPEKSLQSTASAIPTLDTMPGDQNQMKSLNIDYAGLAVVYEELIKIDRSLRHHLNGQTEPPEDVSAWVLVNTRVE